MKPLVLLLITLGSVYATQSTPLYYYNNGKKVYLQKDITRSLSSDDDVYIRSNNTIKIKNSVIAKFHSKEQAQTLLKGYFYKRLYGTTYQIQTNSSQEAIELANKLYESGEVFFAQPNIAQKAFRR
ncbi:MAG: hypothetical protein GXO11_00830 [Epsilonproteobacteria bacterium]|nr:hypothetical protein [Campylobacterota bacterium]